MNLVHLVRQKHRNLKAQGRRFKFKKPTRILPPKNLEIAYQTKLRRVADLMAYIIRTTVMPALPDIITQAGLYRPNSADPADGEVRFNAWADILDRTIAMAQEKFQAEFDQVDAQDMARDQAKSVNQYNKVNVERSLSSMVGFDVFIDEPWLDDEIKSFTNENVSLIDSIPQEQLSDVNETINRMVRQGYRVEDIQDEVLARYQVSRSKANLIGRDQTNKFNGSLNMLRQKAVGLERYYWRGVDDDRERETHVANNDRVFRWDSPPATGHPGEDYQCRCWAEPYMDDEDLEEAA